MAKAIPQGMHTVTPSITVDGCTDAIEIWKKAFGAEELSRAPDPTGKKIWHAALRIGDSTIFTSDAAPEMGNDPWKTRLWLYFENVDSAFKRATGAGLKATMPPTDMFWGDRFGKFKDPFGHEWSVATTKEQLSPEEMKRRGEAFAKQMRKG